MLLLKKGPPATSVTDAVDVDDEAKVASVLPTCALAGPAPPTTCENVNDCEVADGRVYIRMAPLVLLKRGAAAAR